MSMNGVYVCAAKKSVFTVKNSNDQTGTAQGTFELDGIVIPVNIHYHFKNNVGPDTDLWFAGNTDNTNEYVGGAGNTSNQGYPVILLAGGYPTAIGVQTFEGSYVRQ